MRTACMSAHDCKQRGHATTNCSCSTSIAAEGGSWLNQNEQCAPSITIRGPTLGRYTDAYIGRYQRIEAQCNSAPVYVKPEGPYGHFAFLWRRKQGKLHHTPHHRAPLYCCSPLCSPGWSSCAWEGLRMRGCASDCAEVKKYLSAWP